MRDVTASHLSRLVTKVLSSGRNQARAESRRGRIKKEIRAEEEYTKCEWRLIFLARPFTNTKECSRLLRKIRGGRPLPRFKRQCGPLYQRPLIASPPPKKGSEAARLKDTDSEWQFPKLLFSRFIRAGDAASEIEAHITRRTHTRRWGFARTSAFTRRPMRVFCFFFFFASLFSKSALFSEFIKNKVSLT